MTDININEPVLTIPRKSVKKNLIAVAFFWSLIIPSTLFPLIGISGSILTFMVLSYVIYSLITKKINQRIYFFLLLFLASTGITIMYWQDMRLIIIPVSIIISFVLCYSLEKAQLARFLRWATTFFIWLLVLCWVGFFYSLASNGHEMGHFKVFERDYYFLLSTFTVVKEGAFIRPSGIFLEPGHLIWILSCLILVRNFLQMNTRKTLLLLALGTITFSIAYYIFVLCYLISFLRLKKLATSGTIIIILLTTIYFSPLQPFIDSYVVQRFMPNANGTISGDNRSFRFINAVNLLNIKTFSLGVEAECYFNSSICDLKYGKFGENPLTPLANSGIFNSAWYYFILIYLTTLSFFSKKIRGKRFMMLGIAAIFIQQPIVLQLGYSFWPVLIFKITREKR